MNRSMILVLIVASMAGWAWSQNRGETGRSQSPPAAQPQQPRPYVGPKWEYWTVVLNPPAAMKWLGDLDGKTPIPEEATIRDMCNLAGYRGWELIQFESIGPKGEKMFYFKRPAKGA